MPKYVQNVAKYEIKEIAKDFKNITTLANFRQIWRHFNFQITFLLFFQYLPSLREVTHSLLVYAMAACKSMVVVPQNIEKKPEMMHPILSDVLNEFFRLICLLSMQN